MEKTFKYQQFNIRYQDVGEGVTVVLLHGFGEDSRIWHNQVAFLRHHCRLIIPDLPASGGSMPTGDDPEGQILHGIPASIDQMAEAVHALLQKEKVFNLVLLGHSMGGYISLAFAEKYPEMLLGLGLIHSTAFADSDEKKATRRKGIGFIQKNGGYAFLQTAIPGLFSQTFNEAQPGIVNELVQQFSPELTNVAVVDAALVAYYEAMINRPDRTAVLKSSHMPVLFIIGTEDKAVTMPDIMKQVTLPEMAHIHILEGTGHMGMLETAGSLNTQMHTFINNLTATPNKE